MIVILDFGSQFTQLIARRIRAMGVFAEIFPPTVAAARAASLRPDGIILSGGPSSVYEKGAPQLPDWVLRTGVPVLGICYGMQLLSRAHGGTVARSPKREYGLAEVRWKAKSALVEGLPPRGNVWMSHGDKVDSIPAEFKGIAQSPNCPFVAMEHRKLPIYGIQFHPEVVHTANGELVLRNFVLSICRAPKNWRMKDFVSHAIESLKEQVGNRRVICGVSGGVDSTVLAALLHRAIGKKLSAVLVDNGLLRRNEPAQVKEMFAGIGVPLKVVKAEKRFLDPLVGVVDPEEKRRHIGRVFIETFYPLIGARDFLAQGTLYPDVIESVSTKGPSATIKTHHNRVAEVLRLIEEGRIVEPLKELFKDEVREVGKVLRIPKDTLWRHPFPGPGLAIRVLGEVTKERLEILRSADVIMQEELRASGEYDRIWQAFVVLLPVRSVGVMGDGRTYDNVAAIRAVTSQDGMTADWHRMPYDLLGKIANRIINEVRGINRVTYDVSSKPPATIEWE